MQMRTPLLMCSLAAFGATIFAVDLRAADRNSSGKPSGSADAPNFQERKTGGTEAGAAVDCKALRTSYDNYIKAKQCDGQCSEPCNVAARKLKASCPDASPTTCN